MTGVHDYLLKTKCKINIVSLLSIVRANVLFIHRQNGQSAIHGKTSSETHKYGNITDLRSRPRNALENTTEYT